MKTAMQKFKDWYYDPNGFYLSSEVEDKINELIEKEKGQLKKIIRDAINLGRAQCKTE